MVWFGYKIRGPGKRSNYLHLVFDVYTFHLSDFQLQMIDFIENCGEDKDKRVIICHGNDLQTLVNQMTYCGLVDQFMQSFGRANRLHASCIQ